MNRQSISYVLLNIFYILTLILQLELGEIGAIRKIRLQAADSRESSSVWSVQQVELQDSKTHKKLLFDFSSCAWVDERDIVRELPVTIPGTVTKPGDYIGDCYLLHFLSSSAPHQRICTNAITTFYIRLESKTCSTSNLEVSPL